MNDSSIYPGIDSIPSPRKLWYNPKLDLSLSHKITPAMQAAIDNGEYDNGTEAQSGPLNDPDASHPANLVSSLCDDGSHRPALDIDVPFTRYNIDEIERWVPGGVQVSRSAGGNCHAYGHGLALSWPDYVKYLCRLVGNGWIDQRYFDHSITRGQTLLRLPGVGKFAQLNLAATSAA